MHPLAAIAWFVLGLPTIALVTVAGGRLLGARRGWVALLVSGVCGWIAGLTVAGSMTDWRWSSIDMVAMTVVFGTLFTMIVALGLDFLAPVGQLKRGKDAGLVVIDNPLGRMRRRRATLRRYREIIHLARENGVVGRRIDQDALPDGVRHTLEQAGGIFVKMGQVASTRSDVLPQAWCEELARLRSGAAPAPRDEISALLEEEIGVSVDERYAEFDWTPLASASIAQVYAATDSDGAAVVVKVQRPGLDERVAVDRQAILQLAGLVERHTSLGLSVRPVDLVTEFLDNVAEELDFRIEAANAAALTEALVGVAGVRIPFVDVTASGRRVLTEERVFGGTVSDTDRLRTLGLEPREVADRLVGAYLTQIFDAGVFHADPHPGNILVEDDGTIVLIDLGAVGRLSTGQRSATLGLMVAAAVGDAALIRQALTEIVEIDDTVDLRALDRAIERLLSKHMRPGQGISADAFADLAIVTGQFGMRFPDWLATLTRTMVTLEGTLRSIDPDFSIVDAARSRAGDLSVGGGPAGLRGAIEQEAMRQLPRLRRIPERIDSILTQASEGKWSLRLSFFGDPRNERILGRLFDRVVLAIIAASLGLGSVMLLDVKAGPDLGTDITLNEVLGYVGIITASVLVMRIIAGIVRDGNT